MTTALTADQTYKLVSKDLTTNGTPGVFPVGEVHPFTCPHCSIHAQHFWGVVQHLSVYPKPGAVGGRQYRGAPLVCGLCQNCRKETLFLDGNVIFPFASQAPKAAEDMPLEILDDYEEARRTVSVSPRGAAALLRLVIQKLCPLLGATKSDINGAIGELVKAGKISPLIQQALDTVRVVGNEAVHPGTLDLKDDNATAISLFGLVNFIVEKAITEPKRIGELFQTLPPEKLAGIAQRDGAAGTAD